MGRPYNAKTKPIFRPDVPSSYDVIPEHADINWYNVGTSRGISAR